LVSRAGRDGGPAAASRDRQPSEEALAYASILHPREAGGLDKGRPPGLWPDTAYALGALLVATILAVYKPRE
jgi:hypothetical protein